MGLRQSIDLGLYIDLGISMISGDSANLNKCVVLGPPMTLGPPMGLCQSRGTSPEIYFKLYMDLGPSMDLATAIYGPRSVDLW